MVKTKEQIMTETFEFYSTPSNRAARENGGCFYLDIRTGNKCAVGRCLDPNAELEKIKDSIEVRWSFIQELFLPEYQGHDIDFWVCLQEWHDQQLNFFNDKLSVYGVRAAKKIWERFSREQLPQILKQTIKTV
jgi:hypothetical protein